MSSLAEKKKSLEIPIGVDDYRKLITPENRYLFVDKTAFIEEMLLDGSQVALITRPRRWGKTLNMSMLYYFLSKSENKRTITELFKGLAITQSQEWKKLHQDYQNEYPVILISFKTIKSPHYKKFFSDCYAAVRDIYRNHRYLIDDTDTPLAIDEQEDFKRFISGQLPDATTLERSLSVLSTLLHKYHGKNVYIIIDEYDTPLNNAYNLQDITSEKPDSDFRQIIDFMKNFFNNALKGNPSLKKGIVTGILRVAQESLFSDFNNPDVYTPFDEFYTEHFGFTQKEVDVLLEKTHLIENRADVKQWYNGYHFGEHTLYNPWSINSYLKRAGILEPYWVNTSENTLIKVLVQYHTDTIAVPMQALLRGETIQRVIDHRTAFRQLHVSEKYLWSLMAMTGYLDVTHPELVGLSYRCDISIPNKEVRQFFEDIIREWLSLEEATAVENNLMYDLVCGNWEGFKERLEILLLRVVSFHDTSKTLQEQFYHGLLLGTAILLHPQDYTVESNKESGFGRFDLAIVPKDNSLKATILEFKAVKADSKDNEDQLQEILHTKAQEALNQIDVKRYDASALFTDRDVIQKVGIAFSGKRFSMVIGD